MTSSLPTSRPRGLTSHIGVRLVHAAFGGLAAMGWLLLPTAPEGGVGGRAAGVGASERPVITTVEEQAVAPTAGGQSVSLVHGRGRVGPVGSATAVGDGTDGVDLILPVAVAGAVVIGALYSVVRRRRRGRLRTTPGGVLVPPVTPLSEVRGRAERLLVGTDDSVRTSAEEVRFAAALAGHDAAEPFVEALADARGELAVAFRAGQRLDDDADTLAPDEERALLEEILTRCTTAQRRLDTAAPAFDQLRALERDVTPALECAEARFHELTGRTVSAATTLTTLRDTYAPTASLPVTGHVEEAKDRLVFATAELNRARQAAYPGDVGTAAVHLRAAEGAIDQADVFVTGVERLAVELVRAAEAVKQDGPAVDPYAGPLDPLDVLRRRHRPLLPARSTVAAATDFVTTHRGAVAARARTRLAEAWRHLARAAADSPETDTPHARRAHTLAEEARHLAEQDVRAYGTPYGDPVGDTPAGALLGGIILAEEPGGGGQGEDWRGPACYGGTATRARRAVGGRF
ncbi:hypothetical protein WBG99_11765 [Streptomyces sp. TG1A-60]|uniref:hypothetical protein n=1 Tax=Streptomyces sp. TG1A-60 TaxID=3129111 RepID=UPI0030D5C1DD